MIRVRHTVIGDAYMLDNGEKALRIDEDYIDRLGREIDPRWYNDANPVIDMITTVEVGGEYDLEEIPEKDGTVIMSMNEAASGWVVLTYNFRRWNFGTEEYHPEILKCKWKVLSL